MQDSVTNVQKQKQKFSSPMEPLIGHYRSNCPMEEISEDEAKSFEYMCVFLSLFHFLSDHFDMDPHDFDFNTLRNEANVKESFTKIWITGTIQTQIPLLLILQRMTKKFHFLLFLFQFFSKLINLPFRMKTLSHCERTIKIWQNQGNQSHYLHRTSFYCHQKQSQQTETFLLFISIIQNSMTRELCSILWRTRVFQ